MRRFLGCGALLLLAASSVSADAVHEPWNKALRDYVMANQLGTSEAAQLFAQVHVAQYLAVQDALQAKKMAVTDAGARDAALQPELAAAVAGAGKAVMDRVAPAAASFYAQTFESQAGPQNSTLRAAGTKAATIGDQVVQQRANDGSATLLPEERGSTDAGMWRPTAPEYKAGTDMHWSRVTPWVVEDVPQNFKMGPPPALDSELYKASYMQVLDLGKSSSQGRTPEQTETALLWEFAPEPALFGVLDQLTANMSVPEAARAYALTATALADSRTAAVFNKWEHKAWRPVTAITTDNGEGFEVQADWMPLETTPPNPEWPTGHGVAGGAAAEVYNALTGTDMRDFTVTFPDGQTRAYQAFSQVADEVAVSRVYSGTHWAHTSQPSRELGATVARAVIRDFDRKVSGVPADKGRRNKKGGKRALRAEA